jgi:hypothetical protein
MTRDEIIRMAREAGLPEAIIEMTPVAFERFAALVAAAEREACAKVVEEFDFEYQDDSAGSLEGASAAIRARGQA